ncbi:MAG: alpha/beta hydrolase [Eubacteriales bacterium]
MLKTFTVYRPSSDIRRLLCWNGCEDSADVFAHLDLPHTAVVGIGGLDWNRELSPWPAGRVFRRGEDFAGLAEVYLRELTGVLLPRIETELGCAGVPRGIAGYSLAGLFAVWALYRTDTFDRAASMSGSLWFDGFMEFMEQNEPLRLPDKLYLSLGDREKLSRNARMAQVEVCTVRTAEKFRGYGTNVRWEQNPGGHFSEVSARIARGLQWIGE